MADDRALLHASRAHWVLVPAAAARQTHTSEEVDSCDVDDTSCSTSHLRIALPVGSVQIGGREVCIGSEPGSHIHVDCSQVRLRVSPAALQLLHSVLRSGAAGAESKVCLTQQRQCTASTTGCAAEQHTHRCLSRGCPAQQECCVQVDARHAHFTSQGREVFVTDLGSKHGTSLNERALQPKRSVRLAPGDHLAFGGSGKDHTQFLVKMVHNKVRDLEACCLAKVWKQGVAMTLSSAPFHLFSSPACFCCALQETGPAESEAFYLPAGVGRAPQRQQRQRAGQEPHAPGGEDAGRLNPSLAPSEDLSCTEPASCSAALARQDLWQGAGRLPVCCRLPVALAWQSVPAPPTFCRPLSGR